MATALTPEEIRAEARTTNFLFYFAFLLVTGAVVFTLLWGLPGLTALALGATALVFGMLAAYAAGF